MKNIEEIYTTIKRFYEECGDYPHVSIQAQVIMLLTAQRVAVMYLGRLVENGGAKKVCDRPRQMRPDRSQLKISSANPLPQYRHQSQDL